MMNKISEIVMVENYMKTLQEISPGETCMYKSPHSRAFQGFKMAKSRMKKKGIDFTVELTNEGEQEFIKIKRLKKQKNKQT